MSRPQHDAFRAELEAGNIHYGGTLVNSQGNDSESLLTERQQEIVGISLSLSEGYYDYPRKCTLTDLAATLVVDK